MVIVEKWMCLSFVNWSYCSYFFGCWKYTNFYAFRLLNDIMGRLILYTHLWSYVLVAWSYVLVIWSYANYTLIKFDHMLACGVGWMKNYTHEHLTCWTWYQFISTQGLKLNYRQKYIRPEVKSHPGASCKLALKSIQVFFWVFLQDYSWITGLRGKGENISLTHHYHFHPLHRHLDISRVITEESSPLHIVSNHTWTENLWFPSASHSPLCPGGKKTKSKILHFTYKSSSDQELRAHYWKRIGRELFRALDKSVSLTKVSMFDAMNMFVSWNAVLTETINNCIRKAETSNSCQELAQIVLTTMMATELLKI